MILAVDMGNTHTEVGIVDGDRIAATSRIATDLKKTETEYAALLYMILTVRKISPDKVEGAVISSVVPSLTHVLKEAVKLTIGKKPLVVGPGIRNGLKIAIDDPKTLGADMVVDAVGGIKIYGSPLVIIDMGTATTITVVDKEGVFRGGAIVPGVKLSLEALAHGTSQLPMIGLESPGRAVGTNTIECMKSGIIYGQAALLDGMIDRMREEMGCEAKVVATGGLARVVIPYCRHEIILDNELMIKGLKLIYDMNKHVTIHR